MNDICQAYGGGGQLAAGFVPALMRASAVTTSTPYSGDAAAGLKHWGLVQAMLLSNMNASIGKPNSLNSFVMDNGVNSVRTVYIPDQSGADVTTDGLCPTDVVCKNPNSEFLTSVCDPLQSTFCIDDDTIRRLTADNREMVTVEVPGQGRFSMPMIIPKTFNTYAAGLLRRLNTELWGQVYGIAGVNAVNGSSAIYPFNVTNSFFGNEIRAEALQQLTNIQFLNGMGKMHLVGYGNFANFWNTLISSVTPAGLVSTYYASTPWLMYNNKFWFHPDPEADGVLGPNGVFLFDDGKVQLLTQNMKGSPDWKRTGNFDPNNPATLTTWTETSETNLGGDTLDFLMPIFDAPGLFLDVQMERLKCVGGQTGVRGWQVTMYLKYGVYKIPSSFYSATGSLAGTTKAVLIQTNAA